MARKRSTRKPTNTANNKNASQQVTGRRELIFLASSESQMTMTPEGFVTSRGLVSGLAEMAAAADINIHPLFGPSEERVRAAVAHLPNAESLVEMPSYYHVDAPDERLEELADSLMGMEEVAAAYVKPAGEPPEINDMVPSLEEAPSTTPDFSSRQIYLNAAPAGIDARYAWGFRGGRGAGTRIIDCEWGWRFGHEDLIGNQGGVVVGTGISNDNHGTAVLGEYSGDDNGFGVVGICSDAFASAASFATLPTATVIRQAADRLRAGDILLLEIHRSGPDASGAGQDGYIAVEWWPDDLAAIQYAVSRGVIVVEAAGNGARNLDAAIFDTRPTGFPATWRNPFNPANPTSGAVLVGAGAPPPGTHGNNHGPDRSRLGFSNYGRRVDAQGWGREVTTTGYGDLQGGSDRDLWYTDRFSGTSSASPIVVGALGSMQGILRANHKPLLTPASAITLLRSTGSPQQDAPGRPSSQRIGNRPNLRQMISRFFTSDPIRDVVSPQSQQGADAIELNLDGRVRINIRSNDVSIDVGTPAQE